MPSSPGGTLPRFLVPALDPADAEVSLPPDEARHLTRVLRLAPGDLVSVFDGQGREFRARVARTRRDAAVVTLLDAIAPAREPAVALSLVQAVLKGPSMDDVVRDATMMGVRAIQAVISAHVAVKLPPASRPRAVERWQRVAVASAKQCGRARVPALGLHEGLQAWLDSSTEELTLLFVEPSASADVKPLRALLGRPAPSDAALVVGPEGGWAPEEIAAAVAAGCVPVTLGGLTLRASAVALAVSAMVRLLWEDA